MLSYLPTSVNHVHYLDELKGQGIVDVVRKFKENRSVIYKNSREILGKDSQCNFDVSALIEGTNKDSGRFINKLGFYSSCEAKFRPNGSKKSTDPPNTEYKKYYLAKIEWLFGKLHQTYVGYCVPD
jgi:hypothetical protein